MLVGFCLALAVTLATMVYAYWISERQLDAAQWVNHTEVVLSALAEVRAALADTETAISNYATMGNKGDWARYGSARDRVTDSIKRLTTLTADNPSQQARLKNLSDALQTYITGMLEVAQARRVRGFEATQNRIGFGVTVQQSAEVQTKINGLGRIERQLLTERIKTEQADMQRFKSSVVVLMTVMLITLVLLYWVIRRHRAAELQRHLSEERFRLMAEQIVEYGMFMLDPDGRVTSWNPGAERIKGYRANEIVGQHFSRFYTAEDVAQGKPAKELATAAAEGRIHDEGWRVRKDGTRFWADVLITALRDETGTVRAYAKLSRDMTERKRADERLRNEIAERERIDADLQTLNESLVERVAERTAELSMSNAELQRSELRLSRILDSAMDAIITVDESQHIVMFNAAAEAIFGYPRGAALGAPLAQFIPERFRASHSSHVRNFGDAGTTSRRMGAQRVVTGLRSNGEEFPIDASISHISGDDGRFYTVILRDVTRRVRAEEALRRSKEELRELATMASSAREQEKSRVARELHDELAQSLTALKMDLSWLGERLAPDQEAQLRKLAQMRAMVDGAITATRRISADLRPLILDDLGLVPAAEWLVQNFKQRTGIECELVVDPPEFDLQDPHATAIFRILQESLTNVAKHAQASQVQIKLQARGTQIELTLRDDGCGFHVGDPRKPGSLGLAGLRERAYLIDGEITIDSAPGRGTLIEVHIPFVFATSGEIRPPVH